MIRRPPTRWAGRVAALAPALLVAAFVTNAAIATPVRVEVLALLVATLWRPALGLMLLALVAPLGDVLVPILGALPAHHAEALVLAFLAGWWSARVDDEDVRAMPPGVTHAMWVFAAVLIASVGGTALQLWQEHSGELRRQATLLIQSYLVSEDVIGAHTAAQFLEGLCLVSATAAIVRTVRDRMWLQCALIAAGTVAAVASALAVFDIAPEATVLRHALVGTHRYSAILGDVNATASLYLLLAGVAAGMAAAFRRTRAIWLAAAAVMAVGVALTGSRVAVMAAAVLGCAWLVHTAGTRLPRRAAWLLAIAVIAGMTAAVVWRSRESLEMRTGFTRASLHFIEARPVFGIGVGRYYPTSQLVLPPQLGALYGRENAHDYFLQIVAELGIVGAVAFGWVLAAVLAAPIGRVWGGRADPLMVGGLGGAAAFLVTAVAGHPFLVTEAATPFWIVLGVLVAPRTEPARSAGRPLVAIAIAAAILLSTPFRGGVPRLRLSTGEDGLGPPQTDAAGRPFREAETYSSLFIGRTVTMVEIPLRVRGNNQFNRAHVALRAPGTSIDTPVGSDWTTVEVPLRIQEPLIAYKRINLVVTAWGGAGTGGEPPILDVGQVRVISAE